MTELLPCPFCGSAATTVEIDTHDSWDYIAACNNDECKLAVHTHGFPDEPAAIEAWNTRATAAPVVAGEDVGLLKFVAEVMEGWHEGDLDGGDRQDWAEKYGLLIPVEVTESCGENCGCSEYGDFPLTCYRPSPVLQRCRDVLTAALAGD